MSGAAASPQAEEAALARAHPLTLFGFDALVAGAARPRPAGLAFADRHEGAQHDVTYADLYQRVGACLSVLRGWGLARGEKVLICCAPGAQSFVALTAALAAGLDPALAPLPLPFNQEAIVAAAKSLGAVTLLAPAQFCGLDFTAAITGIAGEAPTIRRVGALYGKADSAEDLSPAALQGAFELQRLSDDWGDGERGQIGALDESGVMRFLSQGALLGAALDLVRATRACGEAPILSLSAPNSLCGLVAGPLAALIAGAPLHFLAPFKGDRFLETLAALGPARLVAPAKILADLGRAGLLANGAVVSVAALRDGGRLAPLDVATTCPVIDLFVDGGSIRLSGAAPASN
jgi:hypothetical protein